MGKKYIIKKVFPTLQGEGMWAGTPAVFVRFAGCNLACPWCDTDFKGGIPMDLSYLLDTMSLAAHNNDRVPEGITHVVYTGGEPGVQLDRELVQAARTRGFLTQQIETNGTKPEVAGMGLDWITCSPKEFEEGGKVWLPFCNELKYVVAQGEPLPVVPPILGTPKLKYLSPRMDHTKDGREAIVWENIDWCVNLAHHNPGWRLTMQLHKIWGIE